MYLSNQIKRQGKQSVFALIFYSDNCFCRKIRVEAPNAELLGMKKIVSEDVILSEAESRAAKYLFKVKCSRNIKALIKRNMEYNRNWENVGCGFEGVEDIIQLQGWSQSRRVIILRKKIKNKDIGVLQQKKSNTSLLARRRLQLR